MPQRIVRSAGSKRPVAVGMRGLCSGAWPLAIGLLAIGLLASGCYGRPDEPAGSAPPGSGPGDTPPDPDAPDDADDAAENPALFKIAEQYFPGNDARPGLKRVFRLTRQQLDLTTQALLPAQFSTSAFTALPRDPLQTNYEYANNLSINSANFTPYAKWVEETAARVTAAPESVIACPGGANTTCLSSEATRFVQRAFRGVVSDAQLARYADLYVRSVAEVGFAAATRDLVQLTLDSSHYLFRDETRTDDSQRLLPAQLLQNLTYTLADAPPEALGLSSLTAEQHVAAAEDLQRTVDQVLASPQARAKLLRFFKAWLEVKEPETFDLSRSVFPEFTPEVARAVVTETEAFLNRQLAVAVPRLKDLTEATQSVVADEAAFLYGLSRGSGSMPVELDSSQRLGIFTQPAVIASHSGPTTTRLVKRGVFFVRKVMCMELGNPPPGTDTSIPEQAAGTERQKVESVTANAPCAGCHALINPFGFMQEAYDAIGRFRRVDERSQPIDTHIRVGFLDEGPFETSSPVDALKRFTRSYRFQQCFARQLFRFYTGRDESTGDNPTLRRMFFDFANQDKQEIVGMLRSLVSSNHFSRRAEAP
jgi:hypothetical protein